jgi:hypothetical protein
MSIGDVNGDGAIDLLLGDRVMTNDGTGHFLAGNSLPPGLPMLESTLLVDVDCDHDLDVWRGADGLQALLLNDGTGVFTNAPTRVAPLNLLAGKVGAGYLDDDGDPELFVGAALAPWRLLWNQHRHLANPSPPIRDASWNMLLFGMPGYGPTVRYGFISIGLDEWSPKLSLGPLGNLGIIASSTVLQLPTTFQPWDGARMVSVFVPPISALAGMQLLVQGFVDEPLGPHLTAMLTTTIQ